MDKFPCLPGLILLLLTLGLPPGGAGEFDVDAQRVVLRRLQLCQDCGAALLVTRVHPGVPVRCPDCGREQPRLADDFLLTQLYQLCQLCGAPLDSRNRSPGEIVECGNCRTRQVLSGDAFLAETAARGVGYVPGFPPGSGKKKLLFSPEIPEAAIAPIPLEDESLAALASPPPPGDSPSSRPPGEALPPESGQIVEVPAVTLDLFTGGGKRPGPAAAESGWLPAGGIAARVDGAAIYLSELNRFLELNLRRSGKNADAGNTREGGEQLRREILERLIDRELAVREAAALGYLPDPGEVRRREIELRRLFPSAGGLDYRREAVRDAVMADMRNRLANRPGAISPMAARDYYRERLEQFKLPRRLALDQITIFEERAGRPDRRHYRLIAGEISAALERGAAFAELKASHGEFPDPAPPSLLPESAYASLILESAGDFRRGAVFGPVFLDGLALFGKVADERPAGPAPFAEVEGEIRRLLEAEAGEKAFNGWLKRLRQKAKIVYSEAKPPA
ncbi:MAG: peptidylprolyl isomerase [Planctomycetota bacterium]|jgi:hypothetical protein|nr:peptidylprolyl isomerase [Planctomycetota bacterium]